MAAVLIPPCILLFAISKLAVNVPYWDDWRWVDMIVKFDGHRLSFADLWHPEGDHRILVPSLVALGLSRLGGYSTVIESYFSFACGLLSLAFVYGLLRRTMQPRAVFPLTLVASFVIFSLSQLTTYLWGFQIAWTMIDALALAVLFALSANPLGLGAFGFALAASLTAALSSAQGLGTLAVGAFVLAVQRPLPRRYLAIWIAASVIAAFAYFRGLAMSEPVGGFPLQEQVQRVAVLPTVLGAPLCGWAGVTCSLVAGCALLAAGAIFFADYVRLVRRRDPAAERWKPWIALAAFGLLGCSMIALGRGPLGIGWALQERYVTLASMAWLGMIPLGALEFERVRLPSRRSAINVSLALCAVLFSFEYTSTVSGSLEAHQRRVAQLAAVRTYRSVDDATLIATIFPNPFSRAFMREQNFPSPDRVRELIAGLEENHEGPFRD